MTTQTAEKYVKAQVEPQRSLVGVIDSERTEAPAEMPDLSGAVGQFLATPNVGDSTFGDDIRSVSRGSLGPTVAGIRDIFLGWKEAVLLSDLRANLLLDAFYLYVPPVEGCKATLTVSGEQAREGSASFTIMGIGGGPELKLTLTEEITRSVTIPERICVLVPVVFDWVSVERGATVCFPRLKSIDHGKITWQFLDLAPMDNVSADQVLKSDTFDQRCRHGGTTTKKIALEKAITWTLKPEVDLESVGIKIGVTTDASYVGSVCFEYELPDGHVYVASQLKHVPGVVWKTD
jgi:hypothetical protein